MPSGHWRTKSKPESRMVPLTVRVTVADGTPSLALNAIWNVKKYLQKK
jgi:hypothetical protein